MLGSGFMTLPSAPRWQDPLNSMFLLGIFLRFLSASAFVVVDSLGRPMSDSPPWHARLPLEHARLRTGTSAFRCGLGPWGP